MKRRSQATSMAFWSPANGATHRSPARLGLVGAYQRLDADAACQCCNRQVYRHNSDELVACAALPATCRPIRRCVLMGADLGDRRVALPEFQVPAPRNSLQHRSAARRLAGLPSKGGWPNRFTTLLAS